MGWRDESFIKRKFIKFWNKMILKKCFVSQGNVSYFAFPYFKGKALSYKGF